MKNNFTCVMCNGYLQLNGLNSLFCKTCGRKYPIINDIPILIARHYPALLSVRQCVEYQATKISNLKASLSKLNNGDHVYFNIDSKLKGMKNNLGLMRQHCISIFDYLECQESTSSKIDWFYFNDPGWSFQSMLGYFYQDWYGTEQFNLVIDVFDNAIYSYCNDQESLAVLGCGACGVLYHLANSFSVSYGVDLSIPTLMTARQLLNGENVTVYPEAAEWKEIHLKAPKLTNRRITLLAANVMRLPFADYSISAIVTQYMMDLESNHPGYLTSEIHRVLKPGGIWINFSNPFRAVGEFYDFGSISIDKLPTFFEPFGFELLFRQRQRFKHLNFEAVTGTGHRPNQEVHCFVAKKVVSSNYQKAYVPFIDYFGNKGRRLWDFTPAIVEGRTLAIITKTEFRSDGIYQDRLLSVAFSKENEESFPLENDRAGFIEKIFKFINGKRSLREIYSLTLESDIKLTEDEFAELFHALCIFYYLICLSGR